MRGQEASHSLYCSGIEPHKFTKEILLALAMRTQNFANADVFESDRQYIMVFKGDN